MSSTAAVLAGDGRERADLLAVALGMLVAIGAGAALLDRSVFRPGGPDAVVVGVFVLGAAGLAAGAGVRGGGLPVSLILAVAPVLGAGLGPHVPSLVAGGAGPPASSLAVAIGGALAGCVVGFTTGVLARRLAGRGVT